MSLDYDRGLSRRLSEQRFKSAGGDKTFETFTISTPSIDDIEIVAVEGPTLENNLSYPTLRVVDFQILGETSKPSGTFDVRKTFACPMGKKPRVITASIHSMCVGYESRSTALWIFPVHASSWGRPSRIARPCVSFLSFRKCFVDNSDPIMTYGANRNLIGVVCGYVKPNTKRLCRLRWFLRQ